MSQSDHCVPTGRDTQELETDGPVRKSRFDKVAWFYERISAIYSTGQIGASKAWQVHQIPEGSRVLYVGVGAGEDARLAAERDVQLTCIDLSPAMLSRTDRKLRRYGYAAELICDDVRNHQRWGHYDVITANYFLNCFHPQDMRAMLLHLSRLLHAAGTLMIADVAPARGNWVTRRIHELHHAVAIRTFHALGLVPLHPIYDYEPHLASAGMYVSGRGHFRLGGVGPIAYQSLICRRHAACQAA